MCQTNIHVGIRHLSHGFTDYAANCCNRRLSSWRVSMYLNQDDSLQMREIWYSLNNGRLFDFRIVSCDSLINIYSSGDVVYSVYKANTPVLLLFIHTISISCRNLTCISNFMQTQFRSWECDWLLWQIDTKKIRRNAINYCLMGGGGGAFSACWRLLKIHLGTMKSWSSSLSPPFLGSLTQSSWETMAAGTREKGSTC